MTNIVNTADSGHVRTITLNRPEKKNALSDELAWGVVTAIDDAARDDNVWVVAITGSGDSFCAGLDLSGAERFSPWSPQTAQLDDIHWVGHFLLAIRKRCDKPVVGGINGVAVGAGLGLAMATDVRLVSRSAKLMAGYTRIGGSPDGGLTITLPQTMGYENAIRFMMENRTVQGDEAVRLGMAGEVVADHIASPEARHGQIARNDGPRTAVALRTGQHPHRLRQRGCKGSSKGLLREAQAGVPGEVSKPDSGGICY